MLESWSGKNASFSTLWFCTTLEVGVLGPGSAQRGRLALSLASSAPLQRENTPNAMLNVTKAPKSVLAYPEQVILPLGPQFSLLGNK